MCHRLGTCYMTTHFHSAEQNCLIFHFYHLLILGQPTQGTQGSREIARKVSVGNLRGSCGSAAPPAPGARSSCPNAALCWRRRRRQRLGGGTELPGCRRQGGSQALRVLRSERGTTETRCSEGGRAALGGCLASPPHRGSFYHFSSCHCAEEKPLSLTTLLPERDMWEGKMVPTREERDNPW